MRAEAIAIGSEDSGSGVRVTRRIRRIARQLLPPIVAEPIRRALQRRRGGGEWEYRPSGWPDGDPKIHGWDEQSFLATHLPRWPDFVRFSETSGPLGSHYEMPSRGERQPAVSYETHNTIMCFGYVLARAARGRDRLSMLDWGGGIGHYCIYARALLPEVELDYHCRDLPLIAAAGRDVLPDATFHDSDESALARPYDLVLASASLHYARDWRGTLARIASAANPYLYVTRQPFVETAPSFVVVQRPHHVGYLGENPLWFLNRTEFLDEAGRLGMGLLREFPIAERPLVQGAPEQADNRGFLFATRSSRAPA
jgi:putative methyltransferase (TIGR04325 family)